MVDLSRQIFIVFFKLKEEELKGSILVVLANKQDIEGAMSVTEVSSIESDFFETLILASFEAEATIRVIQKLLARREKRKIVILRCRGFFKKVQPLVK